MSESAEVEVGGSCTLQSERYSRLCVNARRRRKVEVSRLCLKVRTLEVVCHKARRRRRVEVSKYCVKAMRLCVKAMTALNGPCSRFKESCVYKDKSSGRVRCFH